MPGQRWRQARGSIQDSGVFTMFDLKLYQIKNEANLARLSWLGSLWRVTDNAVEDGTAMFAAANILRP